MRVSPRTAAAVGAVAAGIIAATLGPLEDDRLTPYRDIGGIWTVCKGVTGPAVIPGRTYTQPECDDINDAAEAAHAEPIARCLPPDATPGQKAAAVLLGYNVGVRKVCTSTFVARLHAKDPRACAAIEWFRIAGKKDCSIPANKCGGIVKRRALERQICEGRH